MYHDDFNDMNRLFVAAYKYMLGKRVKCLKNDFLYVIVEYLYNNQVFSL